MSGPSQSESSHDLAEIQSHSDRDREGPVVSLHESELPDARKRHCKTQILGKAWVWYVRLLQIYNAQLRTDTSMDVDADDDAKVQNTKSQLEAPLGAKFERLLGKMLRNVKYYAFSCNHINILGQLHCSCSNKSQDSNPGFPVSGKSHSTDGARKIAAFYLVRIQQWEWARIQQQCDVGNGWFSS
jgi:hypothetical protein